MKGSMKKLAVFVVIGAIATFIAAAIASAGDKHWKTLHGEYASTGTSTCLTSDLGFTTILTPLPNSKVFLNSHSELGVMTFNRDGTGTLQTKAVFMVPPPAAGAPGPSVAIAGSFISSLQFTCNITDDGTITTELVPGTRS